MKAKMKAQAALEFLMTYGWAILIVIAVVAALYAMGVFTLPRGGLGKCSPCFPSGSALAYVDHNANTLVVRVGPTALRDINATVVGGSTSATVTGVSATGSTVTLTGGTPAVSFVGDPQVTVNYIDDASNLPHSVTITVHGA